MADRTNYRTASSRSEGRKLFKAMTEMASRAFMFKEEDNWNAYGWSVEELKSMARELNELRKQEKEREMFS